MHRLTRRLVARASRAVVLAALLAAAVSAAASATSPPDGHSRSATLGAVTASVLWSDTGNPRWDELRIAIVRDGRSVYDETPTAPECATPLSCQPAAGEDSGPFPAVKLADLDADGEPEVIVDLYTGGAHCCVVAEVLDWTGAGYVSVSRDFADAGYTLARPAGADDLPTFVTADARFAYAFASYADSWLPVRLLIFGHEHFADMTRYHPDSVRADAARALKAYRKIRRTHRSLGVLAAWVADQWRLGRREQAHRFLLDELHAGRLKGDAPWPRRRAYIASLERHLRIWGYQPRPEIVAGAGR